MRFLFEQEFLFPRKTIIRRIGIELDRVAACFTLTAGLSTRYAVCSLTDRESPAMHRLVYLFAKKEKKKEERTKWQGRRTTSWYVYTTVYTTADDTSRWRVNTKEREAVDHERRERNRFSFFERATFPSTTRKYQRKTKEEDRGAACPRMRYARKPTYS